LFIGLIEHEAGNKRLEEYGEYQRNFHSKMKLEEQNKCEKYPIHCAVQKENYRDIPLLVKKGVDINQKNADGISALFLARSSTVLKALLENGADPNFDYQDQTVFSFLFRFDRLTPHRKKMAELLLKHGANINKIIIIEKERGPTTTLEQVIQLEHGIEILFLLANGANPKIATAEGLTACDRISKAKTAWRPPAELLKKCNTQL
jgi:ankyrin repeat protein